MAFFSLLIAVVLFVIGGLAPVFDWDLGEFSPLYWGLAAFAFSFLAPGVIAYTARNRP
jgi:phage shock protein PspC (stress-responsive transcriptional regulator)